MMDLSFWTCGPIPSAMVAVHFCVLLLLLLICGLLDAISYSFLCTPTFKSMAVHSPSMSVK